MLRSVISQQQHRATVRLIFGASKRAEPREATWIRVLLEKKKKKEEQNQRAAGRKAAHFGCSLSQRESLNPIDFQLLRSQIECTPLCKAAANELADKHRQDVRSEKQVK